MKAPLLKALAILAIPMGFSHAQTFGDGPQEAAKVEALPQISVDGNRFVNPDGETVVFRGVALSDPYALSDRGHWNREYFEAAKSWNANIVRIPVHPRLWRERGEQQYLEWIDEGVKWAGELGMHVIIDWHSIGNPLTDVYHRPDYVTDKGETFRFWYSVASRYRGNPTVAFYELWNEPTNRNGRMGPLPWSEYKKFMEDMVSMIQRIDDTAIPLVGGFNYAYDLSHVREDPLDAEGIGYVAHPYPQKRKEPWVDDWQKDWGFVADKYPMVCTEFGFMSADGPGAHIPVIADEVYGEAIIKFFEERGISWTAWVFDPHWSPQLFRTWEFKPTMQGKFFKQKMEELN